MSSADLTALINTMDEQMVEQLLALLAYVELTVSRPPRTGLMMLTVKDSFDTDFHLGEVLVTEAGVIFRGCEGYGMVSGEAPRRALARAAADAVFRCADAVDIQESLRVFLHQEEAMERTRQAESSALVAATKVNFDLMPGA